jgi:dihydropteroate synthase
MTDRARDIEAINLDLSIVCMEMESLGIPAEEVRSFAERRLLQAVKLRKIPLAARAAIEEEARNNSVDILMVSPDNSGRELFSLVLVGSEHELSGFSSSLFSRGDSVAKLGDILKSAIAKRRRSKISKLQLGDYSLPLGERTLIMGILNVTPDSFSDGGHFNQISEAVDQAFRMAEEGADIIDIGGESTRPGHEQISAEEELKRVMPVIKALKNDRSFKLPLSIDTYKAEVAEEALASGVEMLNDIWGLKEDSRIGDVAARYEVPICLMHNRHSTAYEDLIPDILSELEESITRANLAGIRDNRIIIDPGIGFGKTLEQNLEVMRHLSVFQNLKYPLLLGTSRKSIVGKTLDLPVTERVEGTAATVAYGISAGADIVRVHDVLQMRRVAIVTDAIVRR